MGDSETKLNHSPEEVAEIERILSVLDTETSRPTVVPSGIVRTATIQASAEPPADDIDFSGDGDELGVIEDDISPPKSESFEEIGDDSIDIIDSGDDIEPLDITSDLEMVEEPADDFSLEDIGEPFTPADITPPAAAAGGSTLDQLTSLTQDEPDSVDIQDIVRSDDYLGDDQPLREFKPAAEKMLAAQADDMPTFDDSDMFSGDTGEGKVELGAGETEAPELDSLSLSDPSEIQEGSLSDIPDIDLDGISSTTDLDESMPEIPDGNITSADEDLISLDGMDDFSPQPAAEKASSKAAPVSKKPVRKDPVESFDIDSIDEDFGEDIKAAVDDSDDHFEIEPLDDDFDTPPPSKKADKTPAPAQQVKTQDKQHDTLELSERDLRKLKKAILLFSTGVRHSVKDTVIHDRLPEDEVRELVDMIISGKSESSIKSFLESRLGEKITDEPEASRRRIITSRPEYTREGFERQQRIMKRTRIFGASALAAFMLTILSYQFIYKPIMAKRTIKKGVSLILASRNTDYAQKNLNLKQAEDLFKYVDENYAKDYLYGYNSYGRAYFTIKHYTDSIQKLNSAFRINPHHVETLNNLGYFYSRVPDEKFGEIKPRVMEWYYKDPDKKPLKTKLEISIDFYTRVLIKDKKNITALFGIGNAYFYNGEFLKAKKYYEDILKVDPDSIVGYSGLLNLFIERDVFTQVVQLHSDMRDKKILNEVPSPLLAKTADYYIGKSTAKGINARVDFGVQSPRFIDQNDKIYPAVRSILDALNKRDKDYPPLQLNYARLALLENNYEAMKRHIDKAIGLSKNYFAAHQMLGEFHYHMNEPVRAYESLHRALGAYNNPPEFTEEDFYKETETIGKTHFVMGNIFYYFFDRVKVRQGSLDNEIIEEEAEKMDNYGIAQKKYEEAINEKFESPELRYNLGRIYYVNKGWEKALEQWLYLYDDFAEAPELMLSLGNAFYHNGNINAAKGEYLKLIASYEYDAETIKVPKQGDSNHYKIYMSLSTAHNNLAAVYQDLDSENKSVVNYWKSIDYAQRLGRENEYARVNINRAFKGGRKIEPIIDESIPYSIKYYKEDMRKR